MLRRRRRTTGPDQLAGLAATTARILGSGKPCPIDGLIHAGSTAQSSSRPSPPPRTRHHRRLPATTGKWQITASTAAHRTRSSIASGVLDRREEQALRQHVGRYASPSRRVGNYRPKGAPRRPGHLGRPTKDVVATVGLPAVPVVAMRSSCPRSGLSDPLIGWRVPVTRDAMVDYGLGGSEPDRRDNEAALRWAAHQLGEVLHRASFLERSVR